MPAMLDLRKLLIHFWRFNHRKDLTGFDGRTDVDKARPHISIRSRMEMDARLIG